ncbi:MAG TPA: histidine phosphatase family protein [Planctomycetota bacterium]
MSSSSTRIFLFRHAEVAPEWGGRIYGARDVPLAPEGPEQSRRAASRLAHVALAAVVSSGLERTEVLAGELRRPRGLARLDDPGLREVERGEWVGLLPAEVERRWPGAWTTWCERPESTRAPGGESLSDLQARVRPRLDQWAERHAGRTIALVTHGWVIRVVLCELLGLALSAAARLDVRTTDLFVLRWSDGRLGRLDGFALAERLAAPEDQLSERPLGPLLGPG